MNPEALCHGSSRCLKGIVMSNLVMIAAIVVGGLVLVALLAKFVPKGQVQALPYEKDDLFSPAERSFLGVLEQACGDEFRIMGKVRLGDLVKVKAGLDNKERQSAFNRIQSKHVDFVACDPGDLSVQFVVELDDKSHGRPDRQERDAFVDRVMDAAGIPMIHFAARKAYVVQEVRAALAAKLNPPQAAPVEEAQSTVAATVSAAETPSSDAQPALVMDSPKCPSCGGSMIKRKASKGQNAGNEFWGCASYPKCKGIVAVAG